MTQPKPNPGQANKPTDPKSQQQTAHENDPRAELGLKSPTKDAEDQKQIGKREEVEGQKIVPTNDKPDLNALPSSQPRRQDDRPTIPGKESRNDQ